MNVTSLRSIMQARSSWLLCALFQVVLSSLTHGPTKLPCTIHLLSVAVSMMVIFSTPTSHACQPHPPATPPRPANRIRLRVRKGSAALSVVRGAAVGGFADASQRCSWAARRTLPHTNLSASTLKPDLAHRRLHLVDAAPVLLLQYFDRQWVGNRFW